MGEWKALKKASGAGWKELEREAGTGWKSLNWESAYEDFTTYVEVDPSGRLGVTTNTITATTLNRNQSAHIYKDFGVDYFDALNIQFKTRYISGSEWGFAGHFGLANVINNRVNFGSTDLSVECSAGSYYRLVRGDYANHDAYASTLGATYYCTLERSAGSDTATLKIRIGSHTGTLMDVLIVSGFGTIKWRYLYGYLSRGDGDNYYASGWTQNIKIL